MSLPDFDAADQPSPRLQRTRERLLGAAAQQFAALGYSGATTRGIAEAAGVSELTLFRHFGNKKNLFMQTVQQHSAMPGIEAALGGQISGDLRQDLALIGTNFLKTLVERREAILMTLHEGGRLPEVRQAAAQVPRQQRLMLANYLGNQVEAGRLKALDASMMAQAFLGMFFAYAVYQALLEEAPLDGAQIEAVAGLFVEIFLEGATQ
ncbi:MAG: TetR/AcrR family transcriptional regulator [Anaerolineales bacterium]|nr:TetR/AcrR family transcriptional regulator [Anaerolineales bacterium]